jgi:hypothetical protein
VRRGHDAEGAVDLGAGGERIGIDVRHGLGLGRESRARERGRLPNQ